ncbi:thioredoxin [Fadolivirus algeromassiliense]|jgi:glutaredoxin|uniref:Thioredoxin n=1 Tax=Fadolivirus FV1/VV64 TaxID=3070911 RepID=A0A7D3UVM6_9VIRU|nr:thioredoxin [Fadolivirus algeromassiliense]QKF94309.1 thioredoxin [Fadolivirus FV1/VV64]
MPESEPRVILYFADWCGHCKKFKPEWNKLKIELKNMNISFAEYKDGTDDAVIQSAGIRGFPTIRIDGKEYNGDRSIDAILSYLTSDKKGELDMKYQQCGGGARFGFSPISMRGGKGKSDEYYKIKYLKYKAKYMKLRSELGI